MGVAHNRHQHDATIRNMQSDCTHNLAESTPKRNKKRRSAPQLVKDVELEKRLLRRLVSPERAKPFADLCYTDIDFFGSPRDEQGKKRRQQVQNRNKKLESLSKEDPGEFLRRCNQYGVLDNSKEQAEVIRELFGIDETFQLVTTSKLESPKKEDVLDLVDAFGDLTMDKNKEDAGRIKGTYPS